MTKKFTDINGMPHFTEIQKRDGRMVAFNAKRIEKAILKAGWATGQFGRDMAYRLTIRVLNLAQIILKDELPTVEKIQDIVVQILLDSPFRETGIRYVVYREQHTQMREISQKANISLIDDYLDRRDWEVKENSNMGYSLQALNNYISSKVSKDYWLKKIYPPEVCEAHNSGQIHVHDSGIIACYCVGWSMLDVLMSGFQGVAGKVASKPARHLRSALGQLVNIVHTLQGETAGAQSFSDFVTYLAPFIYYDNLKYEDIKQTIQEFVFSMNVPTRMGFQPCFTNVTLDMKPSAILAEQPVVIGGCLQDKNYGQFQEQMNMFIKAFLEVMAEGDANGRPFTFPIPTCNITPDFDWDSTETSLLFEITAKYGIFYFANFINSGMSPNDIRSMCCNLQLNMQVLNKRGGGLFGVYPLTGSIGVVTINMARIGYLSHNKAEFMDRLNKLMELARTSLEIKRKLLERLSDKGLYPYCKFYLRSVKEHYGEYFHNHFSTIGILAMQEACLNLFGCDIGMTEGIDFAIEVLDFMRNKLLDFQKETGNLYNLEATPAEGATCRLAKLDKELYPDIICANEAEVAKGAAPFYTNSTRLPVNYTDDIFKVLELQDELQSRYTGGTVLHVFLGEEKPDPLALKNFVRKVCENYRLPYFTISPTYSVCQSHGYVYGKHINCPTCGGETEVYARVVGYLRPVKQWNEAKQVEFSMRSQYKIGG